MRLFISTETGDKITLSRLALSTDLPLTTVQRRAEQLCRLHLVALYVDESDTRCRLARLTFEAVGKMRQYIDKY